eukprot:TRINITY_DN4023_c0_g2_i3.p1 TRINITY_DN4023_c0_g2~~TRINITY_DN4023_c0_g2_i3.p1  ORF type:complete len:180 (-),score=47.87 TRINITY_DN4023_c0_g2_i3:18-557(-)
MKQEKKELFGSAATKANDLKKATGMMDGSEEKARLIQIRAMMQDELTQMDEISKTMDEISNNLKQTNLKYTDYDGLIGHSGKHVTDLTRKEKRDNLMLNICFIAFLLMVAYIWLKRFRVFSMGRWAFGVVQSVTQGMLGSNSTACFACTCNDTSNYMELRRGFGAVSYTHLTLPTTPYV